MNTDNFSYRSLEDYKKEPINNILGTIVIDPKK